MKGSMYHHTTVTGALTSATRLRNTFSGNPQWKLTVKGYTFRTHPDSDVVYKHDFEDLVNTDVSLRLNDRGRVIDLYAPRTLSPGCIVHLERHLEQLPERSQVQVMSGRHAIYTKRSLWEWTNGPVSVNPQLLLSQFSKLRVVRVGTGTEGQS